MGEREKKKSAHSFCLSPCAVSYTHLDVYKRQVSHYSNPLVVVIKKEGGVRLCLDARKINQIIIPDRESPESIDVYKRQI